MSTKSLSQEIAEIVEEKIASSKKGISLAQTRDSALKLAIKTNGKGRAIGAQKIERAVHAVDHKTFHDIKDGLTDEDIQKAVRDDVSSVPSEMLQRASTSKRLLKKLIGLIVRGAILRLLSQAVFKKGALLLGGLGLAGSGANAVAAPSTENFFATLDPYKYFTDHQVELFSDFLPASDSCAGSDMVTGGIDVVSSDIDIDAPDVDIDIDPDSGSEVFETILEGLRILIGF